MSNDPAPTIFCTLYLFGRLGAQRALRAPLPAAMQRHRLQGTLLLAQKGIYGTIAGTSAAIDALLERLHAIPGWPTGATIPAKLQKNRAAKRQDRQRGCCGPACRTPAGAEVCRLLRVCNE